MFHRLGWVALPALLALAAAQDREELLVMEGEVGPPGGRLVVAERSEPKSFNPVLATDVVSRAIIRRMTADLVHINRETHETEPGLAKSWTISESGRRYTVELRAGIRFSDGHLLDADDVGFSFEVYLDDQIPSPHRELLVIGDEPLEVRKLGAHTVVFELAAPYGPRERLFDSITILPRHILEKPYRDGHFAHAWGLSSRPEEIVGLGPFRLKEYQPGDRVILERNPHYWKKDGQGQRLPYLDELVFLTIPSEDAQVMRYERGEIHLLSRFSAAAFQQLQSLGSRAELSLRDLGPGLEYNFLFFNLNDLDAERSPELSRKQRWFRDARFRQAISASIDREAIVRLVYRGAATPLSTQVTPGNKLWINEAVPRPRRSLEQGRTLLREAGFRWSEEGQLVDDSGERVRFSILTSSSNKQRAQMATIIQEDLRKIGIDVVVVKAEFRSFIDRIFTSKDYDACLAGLASGDVDPNNEASVWLSTGSTHLWRLGGTGPAMAWEAEIDRLMLAQMTSTDQQERKALYDRVQQIVFEELPIIALVSPNILVGAHSRVGNFRPAILDHYTLWNAEQLFFRPR